MTRELYQELLDKKEFLSTEFLLTLVDLHKSKVQYHDISFLYEVPITSIIDCPKEAIEWADINLSCTQEGAESFYKKYAEIDINIDATRLKKGIRVCFDLSKHFDIKMSAKIRPSLLCNILWSNKNRDSSEAEEKKDAKIAKGLIRRFENDLDHSDFGGFFYNLNYEDKLCFQFMIEIEAYIPEGVPTKIQSFLNNYLELFKEEVLNHRFSHTVSLRKNVDALYSIINDDKFVNKVCLNRWLDKYALYLNREFLELYKKLEGLNQNTIERNLNDLIIKLGNEFREARPLETVLLLEKRKEIYIEKLEIIPEFLYLENVLIINKKPFYFPWMALVQESKLPRLVMLKNSKVIKYEGGYSCEITLKNQSLLALKKLIENGESGVDCFDGETESKKIISELRKKIKFETILDGKWITNLGLSKGCYKIDSNQLNAYLE